MAKQITRSEVPEHLTWDLTSIFETDAAWEAELKDVEKLSEQAANFKGKVAESAESLYKTIQFSNQLFERLRKLYVYSHLKHDQDTTNSMYQDLDGRVRSVASKIGATWSFIVPEVLVLDEATLESYVESYEPLTEFKQSLKEINLGRPYVLSADKEELLAQMSEVSSSASTTFSALNNADLEFPKIKGVLVTAKGVNNTANKLKVLHAIEAVIDVTNGNIEILSSE